MPYLVSPAPYRYVEGVAVGIRFSIKKIRCRGWRRRSCRRFFEGPQLTRSPNTLSAPRGQTPGVSAHRNIPEVP